MKFKHAAIHGYAPKRVGNRGAGLGAGSLEAESMGRIVRWPISH